MYFGYKFFSTLYWARLVYWNLLNTLKSANHRILVHLVASDKANQAQKSI